MRSYPSLAFATLALALAPAGARAGAPFLVADLGRTPVSSTPSEFVEMDGRLFFAAHRQLSGRELWVSDGTAAGTRQLREIYPGETGSHPQQLIVLGGRLFFSACEPEFGCELWTSDGTGEGTLPVRDINPGPRGSGPFDLVALGGRLFFAADDGAHGRELWVSDGTAEGTRLLKDVEPSGRSSPQRLRVWRDRLLFTADTDASGRELWISDGTAEGTRLLLDIYPGRFSGGRHVRILDHGDHFYFEGRDESGIGLFVSDGTLEGTSKLDLWSAGDPPNPLLVGLAGDRLVITSSYPHSGVWAGKDGVFERLGELRFAESAIAVGDELFMGAEEESSGSELWRTDGTSAGTRLVADLAPGTDSSTARPFLFESGRLWFRSRDDLWVLEAGVTTRLATSGSNPRFHLGRLWFDGFDDEHGSELWASDGTPGGTGLVRDVNERGSLSWETATALVPFGSRMFIFTSGGLWLTDGSELGTYQVPAPEGLSNLSSPARRPRIGNRIFFLGHTRDTGFEIWWSDGERIELLADHTQGGVDSRVRDLESTGRRIVFATGNTEVVDLWGSDGETVESLLHWDRVSPDDKLSGPGPEILPITEIEPLGDVTLAFLGWSLLDDTRLEELWRSDGTVAGTVRVRSVNRPSSTSSAATGGFVYFFQLSDLFEYELWRSDGRGVGTRRVAILPPGIRASNLKATGERVVFRTSGPQGHDRWWVSDGTAEGTRRILDRPTLEVSAAGGRLYVEAFSDGSRRQRQLWQLDADTLAVEQVIDLELNAAFFPWGEVLYYFREGALWRTDGTPEGTVQLGAPYSDNPRFLPTATAGGLLYFQADDGIFGREMWAVAPECIASREVLCLGGDRFQARSRWNRSGRAGAGRPATVGTESGTFSFFGDDFPEIALKVLDGRALNDHFWALSGTASDLEVDLRLFDVATGDERRHFHPAGGVSSIADFAAFADTPSAASTAVPAAGGAVTVASRQELAGPCQPGVATLCLADDRFAVAVEWRDGGGSAGAGEGREVTDAAGTFVFFGGDNLELLVKVLDGRALNGRFWVYAASLTDVEFELTVKDTVTGAVRVYRNPPGRLGGFGDAGAFPEAEP